MDRKLRTTMLISDKIAGFFQGALYLGYDYDKAWSLLLNSKQGQGILKNNYEFSVHHQGRVSAEKADKDIGDLYDKSDSIEADVNTLRLLADFIIMAHRQFKLKYSDIFKNMSLNEFMKTCGNVLGNYDDKLVKTYLLKEDKK